MDFDRPDEGTRYDDTAFLELQSYLGLTDTAANQGSRLFDEETTRESGGPDGDTHLHYIKQLEAIGGFYLSDSRVDGIVDGVEQLGELVDAEQCVGIEDECEDDLTGRESAPFEESVAGVGEDIPAVGTPDPGTGRVP